MAITTQVNRVAFSWTGAGMSAVNVMHFLKPAIDSLDDLLDRLEANLTNDMVDAVSSDLFVFNIQAQELAGGAGPIERSYSTSTTPWKGINGTAPVPGVAAVVKKLTNEGGRSKRGRVFLPGIAEGAMSQGFIISASLATMQAAWDTFDDDFSDPSGYQNLVVSEVLDDAFDVTSFAVESPVATQRRRQSRIRAGAGA